MVKDPAGYFDDVIDVLVPVHTVGTRARLRSTDHGDMVVPRSYTVPFGQRSFRSSTPCVWNDLPSELKNSDISRPIDRVLNLALGHGVLSVPTRNCEVLFKGRHINPCFN